MELKGAEVRMKLLLQARDALDGKARILGQSGQVEEPITIDDFGSPDSDAAKMFLEARKEIMALIPDARVEFAQATLDYLDSFQRLQDGPPLVSPATATDIAVVNERTDGNG
jgi:hypothetical protein